MADNPFKFCPNNPRYVISHNANWSKVNAGSGLLWAMSVAWYQKSHFRVNKNLPYLMAFMVLSAPASYGYAKFVLSSSEDEAAYMNNA